MSELSDARHLLFDLSPFGKAEYADGRSQPESAEELGGATMSEMRDFFKAEELEDCYSYLPERLLLALQESLEVHQGTQEERMALGPQRGAALNEKALAYVYKMMKSGKLMEKYPEDAKTVLQHGLDVQEVVSCIGHASWEEEELSLLYRACEIYQRANDLQAGTSIMILFNWAVALTDIGRIVKNRNGGEAAEYLGAASLKYAALVGLEPGHAQALNNWGLVIRDLSDLLPPNIAEGLLESSLTLFRKAIRSELSDLILLARCSYNLGTILYQCITSKKRANAQTLQGEADTMLNIGHAAQYIALAYALNPKNYIFEKSLVSVRHFLPLPYVRYGTVHVLLESEGREEWTEIGLALNTRFLQSVQITWIGAEGGRSISKIHANGGIEVDLINISSVHLVCDPLIPKRGYGICISTKQSKRLVFTTEFEDLQGWKDALNVIEVLNRYKGEGLNALRSSLECKNTASSKDTE
eukprot:jgi/Picsp_1/471/NSC_00469-R1_tetratricopeptide repeat domain-containing protein